MDNILGVKSWVQNGFDYHAYKLDWHETPYDYEEDFDKEEILAFDAGEWQFTQIVVTCGLLGIRLGYSYAEMIPDGIVDGEPYDAFSIVREFNMDQEAFHEAKRVIEKLSLEIV